MSASPSYQSLRLVGDKKAVAIAVSILLFFCLLYFHLTFLAEQGNPIVAGNRKSVLLLILNFYSLPILISWAGGARSCSLIYQSCFLLLLILTCVVLKDWVFLTLIFLAGGLDYVLLKFDEMNTCSIIQNDVKVEECEGEKNQLSLEFEKRAKEVEACFAKYSSYMRMREVAERFASSLLLERTAQIAVDETFKFIPQGSSYLLYISSVEESGLSLLNSKIQEEDFSSKAKRGDVFDQWILKNRQSLIVSDIHKDFRFDVKALDRQVLFHSLIACPLFNEGRVVGILRVNAFKTESFATDDLRLLNILADLASSAISNALLYRKVEELAIRDSLTGLYVQRYFKERLDEEHRRSLMSGSPLSLVLCDLDFFKSYNDRFGHAAGDMILERVATILKEEGQGIGIPARYGGEEFAILLPHCAKEKALEIAERIRKRVEETKFEVRRENTNITISIGVATLPVDTLDKEELLRKSDGLLYQAKRMGRNRVCC